MTEQLPANPQTPPSGAEPDHLANPLTLWWLPLITGFLWILVSVVVLRFDFTSVTAVATLFGIIAVGAGLNEAAVAAVTPGTGWKIAHFVLGTAFIVTGIVSFFHPGGTFVALAALVGFFLIFRGTFDVITAFMSSHIARGWWLLLLAGLIELGFGFFASGSWELSVTLLIAFVAATALMHGIGQLALAFTIKAAQDEAESSKPETGNLS